MSERPYGVLGRVLGHSYTPKIYNMLAGLDYVRFEREPDQVEAFLKGDEWQGVNATIPYKRTVMPYLDELSDIAQRLGNVNTITRLPDGRLRGDNTDYYGFQVLVESVGVDLRGKHALVFGGDGGAGSTCMTVLGDLGAIPHAVGRSGDVTYDDLDAWSHAALAVNCTPVGMYPDCPASVCGLESLTDLEAFVDIVYNPARTSMMMDAEERGIPTAGGLLMLVAQAAQAVERYVGETVSMDRIMQVTDELSRMDAEERGIPTAGGLLMLVAQAAQAVERYVGETVSMDRIMQVTDELSRSVENIALIGMPGCGKTRVGERLAELGGREHIDIDREFDRRHGMPAPGFILSNGEDAFREAESEIIADVAKRSGLVISCGGGVVERQANYRLLHQNSRIVMLDRPLDELSTRNRPITAQKGIGRLAETRLPRYRAWADAIITSRESPLATATEVARSLHLPSAHGTTRD